MLKEEGTVTLLLHCTQIVSLSMFYLNIMRQVAQSSVTCQSLPLPLHGSSPLRRTSSSLKGANTAAFSL